MSRVLEVGSDGVEVMCVEYPNVRAWLRTDNGRKHRADGKPAVEWLNGEQEFFIDGERCCYPMPDSIDRYGVIRYNDENGSYLFFDSEGRLHSLRFDHRFSRGVYVRVKKGTVENVDIGRWR